jgi:trans-2,3-dihydro-3-hydroxyanthranilate isomerase
MRRRYFTLDVFSQRRFAGNPLAVILKGDGLDAPAMQAIAAEFNLSETVFVMQPADAARRADIRIFTPKAELPFAGHPTVGTAVLLAILERVGEPGHVALTLGETIGPVACRAEVESVERGHASFDLPRLPVALGSAGDDAVLAAALGLAVSDIGAGGWRPALWSAGVPYALVPVRNRAAVDRATPQMAAWPSAFGGMASGHVYVFAPDPVDPAHAIAARMFAPTLGVPEDPATGSAAACLCSFLAAAAPMDIGTRRLVVEQGYAMGRPSHIELVLTFAAGSLAAATIGGHAVVVSEGEIIA